MEFFEKILPLIVFILIAIFSTVAQKKQKDRQSGRHRPTSMPPRPTQTAATGQDKPLFEKLRETIDTISKDLEQSMQNEPQRPRPTPQRPAYDEEEASLEESTMESVSLESESLEVQTPEVAVPESVTPEITAARLASAPPLSPTRPGLGIEKGDIAASEIGNAPSISATGRPSMRHGAGAAAISVRLSTDKVREGVVLSEILGKPVAMRDEVR
jgi:hypothetical protein